MNPPANAAPHGRLTSLLRRARAPETRQFILFLVVGLLNTAVGYGLFATFVLLGADPALAIVAATILGVLFNFKSIGSLVFGASGSGRLARFIAVYVVQCGLNMAALEGARRLGVQPLLAEAIILPVLAVATFAVMRGWVFAATAPGDEGHAEAPKERE